MVARFLGEKENENCKPRQPTRVVFFNAKNKKVRKANEHKHECNNQDNHPEYQF